MVSESKRAELEKKVLDALFSQDPTQNPQLDTSPFGSVDEQAVRYFIYADVLEELLKAARYRQEGATAILIGQFAMDQAGPFIEVTAFRELKYLYGGDAVELTFPGVREIFEEMQTPESIANHHVVGVFVAQPGGEAHLDEAGARLHLSLFNLPYQVALVIDGKTDRIGLYARAPGKPFFNAAFYLVEGATEAVQASVKDVKSPHEQQIHQNDRNEYERNSGIGSPRNSGQSRQPDGGV